MALIMRNNAEHEQHLQVKEEQFPPPELQGEDEIRDLLNFDPVGNAGFPSVPLNTISQAVKRQCSSSEPRVEPISVANLPPVPTADNCSMSPESSTSGSKRKAATKQRSPTQAKTTKKRPSNTSNIESTSSPKKTLKRTKSTSSPAPRSTNLRHPKSRREKKSTVRSTTTVSPRDIDPVSTKDQAPQSNLPVSSFCDDVELERNVRMDFTTNRGYVYTTDLHDLGLPEFLFLDVPNDSFAISLCGRWITNHLSKTLKEDVDSIGGRFRSIVKDCNLQTYQQDVFHPLSPDGSAGEMITIKFHLRSAERHAQLSQILAQNFIGRPCPRGIVVFLPCIKPKSPFHAFWGNSRMVSPLPEHDTNLTLQRTDNYCRDFARYYGQYLGGFRKENRTQRSDRSRIEGCCPCGPEETDQEVIAAVVVQKQAYQSQAENSFKAND